MHKHLLMAAMAFSALMGGQAYAQQKLTFALVPKNMNNPFFDQARDGCKKAEAESKGAFQCMYIGPGEHGGGEEQVQIVQDLVAKKVDGIAVAPANAAAMAVALQAAKGAGILGQNVGVPGQHGNAGTLQNTRVLPKHYF